MQTLRLLLPLLAALIFTPVYGVVSASQPAAIAAPAAPKTTFSGSHFSPKKSRFIEKMAQKPADRQFKKAIAEASSGRTVALLSYLTLIGWVIALLKHKEQPSSLGGFHLAQSAGNMLLIISAAILLVVPIIRWVAAAVILCCVVNWVVGLIHASNEKETPLPIGGRLFNRLLRHYF